jgi:hypothetical protein
MGKRPVIAVALCVIGALAVLLFSRGRLPLYGGGVLVEILYLLSTVYLLWAIRGPVAARIVGILASTVLVAVIATYLNSVVFAKLDFDIRHVAMGFALHLLAAVTFLGLVWVSNRVLLRIIK